MAACLLLLGLHHPLASACFRSSCTRLPRPLPPFLPPSRSRATDMEEEEEEEEEAEQEAAEAQPAACPAAEVQAEASARLPEEPADGSGCRIGAGRLRSFFLRL